MEENLYDFALVIVDPLIHVNNFLTSSKSI